MAHLEKIHNKIEIEIIKTTGGSFAVTVDSDISVENLKKIVSKKLKISKDRICLMNSERVLQDGTLTENGIVNGSKIILTPNVETGLAQRNADSSVLQALESLNDNQVNDFLSGKSPLNLSVRLGDHLMMIQLQLSTLSPSQQNSLKQKVMNGTSLKQAVSRSIINCGEPSISSSFASSNGCKRSKISNNSDEINGAPEKQQRTRMENLNDGEESKSSPIKSLSSMVSSPLSTTVQSMNHNFYKSPSPPLSSPVVVDPISANLTSCLCKRLNISCNNNCEQRPSSSATSTIIEDDQPCCSSSLNKNLSTTQQQLAPPRLIPFHQRPPSSVIIKPKQLPQSPIQFQPIKTTTNDIINNADAALLNTDNPALAEASRNLTQTLRKLSKRVFTSKAQIMENNIVNRNMTSSSQSSTSSSPTNSSSSTSASSPSTSSAASSSFSSSSNNSLSSSQNSGAVIESMKHHGKGIYSGTFSGTLNPALQDKNGRPKRDISTIIHILNDLLSATPNCAKNGTKIFFEPTQPSPLNLSTSSSSSSSSSNGSSSNTKYLKIKKQSSNRSCIPNIQQKCAYGQCNGHSKTELISSNHGNSNYSDFPSTSSSGSGSGVRSDCTECYQSMRNQKLEMENLKTKSKLDQLKLVMQQKKERREARKLKIAPYNTSTHVPLHLANVSSITTTPIPAHVSPSSSVNGSNLARMNSDASASAIATISSENHMEEVDTVA